MQGKEIVLQKSQMGDISDAELVYGENYLVSDEIQEDVGAYRGLTQYGKKLYRLFVKKNGEWFLAGKNALMEHLTKKE